MWAFSRYCCEGLFAGEVSHRLADSADHAPKGFPVHVGGVYTDPFKHGANLAFIEIGREIEGVMTLLPQRLRDFSGGWHFAFPLFL